MKLAMAPLALLSLVAGVVLIPGVTHTLEEFLHPAFEDSRYFEAVIPDPADEWMLSIVGGALSLAGIALAYSMYMRRRGATARLIDRFPTAHRVLANKWYWDELYDYAIVRPDHGVRPLRPQRHRVGVHPGRLRRRRQHGSCSRARRSRASIQSGYLRAYALLLLIGMFGLALYFLIVSS